MNRYKLVEIRSAESLKNFIMCLRIWTKSLEKAIALRGKPQIATKDIKVWKMMRVEKEGRKNVYTSPFRGFTYKKGFHYYQEGKAFSFAIDGPTLEIHQGLHAYRDKTAAISAGWWNCNPVRMIIPKGAKYYANEIEIVSDQLVFP